MLNNASLLYRMERGASPHSLSQLADGRFIDPKLLVCPHGGAYAFHTEDDTAACSLHNRLKYLTPNAELEVLSVSKLEAEEYGRFRERYQAFWQGMFDPIAVRLTSGARHRLEVCVLPLANGSAYRELREWLGESPRPLDGVHTPRASIASLAVVPGRRQISEWARAFPGVAEVLSADPTLTDLSWVGERVSLHLCDGDTILEVDPSQLRTLNLFGEISLTTQSLASAAMLSASLPAYACIDIEDRDKAQRFLDQLSSRMVLKEDKVLGLLPAGYDAYRLPDYRGFARYVISYRVYALKMRFHVAIVEGHLVAATREETLQRVIDGVATPATTTPAATPAAAMPSPASGSAAQIAHAHLRLNLDSLRALKRDLRLYWAERSRQACHANIMSLYQLSALYGEPLNRIDRLSQAKYGVTYACPEDGTYALAPAGDQVECSVHGNRMRPRQNPLLSEEASFLNFFESLEQIAVTLRFQEECLMATVEVVRPARAAAERR